MCFFPELIINPKYKPNKKNNYRPPRLKDERVKWVPIGCQQCLECRKQKARQWQVRLLEDLKQHKNGKFVTFTFSNEWISQFYNHPIIKELEGYEKDNAAATLAVRLFLERFRKRYGHSLRHWFVTELGGNGTENVHIHGIIWTNIDLHTIEKIWKYGMMWKGKEMYGKLINYVNERTANYITKYVHKVDVKHKYYKSIVLTSPGIGRCFKGTINSQNNRFQGKNTVEYYRSSTGHKIAMPIYFRNKLYTEEQREQLWLNRLDKNERWIGGTKVRADDEKAIYNLLTWYRRLNAELGYGNGQKTWNQEQYEQKRRALMQSARQMSIQERLDEMAETTKSPNIPTYATHNNATLFMAYESNYRRSNN